MQIFKFGGKWGKFQFFLTKPYKECECHQNASFKPLTTIIGPTGGPVAMRMKLKQESPDVADKPARRERKPKIAPIRCAYNVVADNTGLSSFV